MLSRSKGKWCSFERHFFASLQKVSFSNSSVAHWEITGTCSLAARVPALSMVWPRGHGYPVPFLGKINFLMPLWQKRESTACPV